MASKATVNFDTDDRPLIPDSIPTVDLRHLSQSELYALSLFSAAAFDALYPDDVVLPTIDKSVFNESQGSRKQTYSRLRLAPAASAIRRRTPHLRSPKPSSVETDPERAENSQIVSLLKSLFVSSCDSKHDLGLIRVSEGARDDVVSIKRRRGRPRKEENIEIRDIFDNVVAEEKGEVVVGENKRKRGRPSKDGTARAHLAVVLMKNKAREPVVYENVEEVDKGVVNAKGEVVDLAALAELEDPFGEVIRRRTEGMGRVDELLGFLEGLGGRWGSRRKKKKVVDASDFGDCLPKGWKISISLKRKEGRVWLFCRRYISPSGRQFISCKEVSSYLQSISGLQGKNLTIFPGGNENNRFEFEMASPKDADLPVFENNNKDGLVFNSSAAVTSLSNIQEDQISSKIGESMNGQVGDTLKCHKCMMTFEKKDDLLQHHVLSHRSKRSKIGTSITDGVIIRGGLYECQFCHKTFNERKRYNGHVGNHVKYDLKSAGDFNAGKHVNLGLKSVEESITEHMQDASVSSSLADVLNGGSLVEAKIGNGEDIDVEPLDTTVDEMGSDFCMKTLETGLRVETSSDKIVYEQNDLDNGKQNLQFNKYGINTEEASDRQSRECVSSSEKVGQIDDSMDIDPINSEVYVESKATLSNNENDNIFETAGRKTGIECVTDRTIECFAEQEISSPLHQDDHNVSVLKHNVVGISASVKERNKKIASGCSSIAPNASGKPCNSEDMFVVELTCEREKFATIDSVSGCYAEHQASLVASLQGGKRCENGSVASSVSDREHVAEINVNSMEKQSRQQQVSLSSLFSLSGREQDCGVENYAQSLDAEKVSKEVESCGNSELLVSFGTSEFAANVTTTKERSLEFCSLRPSGTEMVFDVQDNVTAVHNSSTEEHGLIHSGHRLSTQSCFPENSSDVYSTNKIYSAPADELKFDDVQTSGNHDLSLAFNNPLAGSYQNANSFELEKFHANWSSIPSRIDQNIGVQPANISRVDNSMVDGVGSLSGLFSLSCNGNLWGSDNNFNAGYTDRGWDGPEVNDVGNSENKKYMVDFGHNNDQAGENLMPDGIWRTGEDHAIQSNLANTSNPISKSPNSFRNFNIVSEKGGEGLFRLNNEKYEGEPCFEGSRPGRTETVEFSFLTTPNLTSLQGNSKNFTYSAGIEQELDSSYWLGKHDLMPNMASSNQVTSLCVWCRNEFHHEPVHSEMQAAIGSLCPTCSTRISAQVNVL